MRWGRCTCSYGLINGKSVLARKPGTDVFRPQSAVHPDDETFPGLLLLKTEGMLNFANVQRVFDLMRVLIAARHPRVVVLDCSAIQDLEYTALKRMTEAESTLGEAGISLWLAGLNPEPLQLVQKSDLGKILGRSRMHFNIERAVENYTNQADGEAAQAVTGSAVNATQGCERSARKGE